MIGRIDDVLIDDTEQRVVGFLVRAGWLARGRILSYADVRSIQDGAVAVESQAVLMPRGEWRAPRSVTTLRSLLGRVLVTAAGAELGEVTDAFMHEHNGDLTALEIATPDTENEVTRYTFVTTWPRMRVDGDAILVPAARHDSSGTVTKG
jgi:uncharacterized protein YrrD